MSICRTFHARQCDCWIKFNPNVCADSPSVQEIRIIVEFFPLPELEKLKLDICSDTPSPTEKASDPSERK